MQADPDAPTMIPSAPPPAPPDPPQAGHALPFWATALLAILIAAGLGAIHGARIAFGAPLPEVAAWVDADPCGTLERDWRRGSLWRPAGSTATRPEPRLRPQVWRPEPRLRLQVWRPEPRLRLQVWRPEPRLRPQVPEWPQVAERDPGPDGAL